MALLYHEVLKDLLRVVAHGDWDHGWVAHYEASGGHLVVLEAIRVEKLALVVQDIDRVLLITWWCIRVTDNLDFYLLHHSHLHRWRRSWGSVRLDRFRDGCFQYSSCRRLDPRSGLYDSRDLGLPLLGETFRAWASGEGDAEVLSKVVGNWMSLKRNARVLPTTPRSPPSL